MATDKKKALFICLGNICRSPIAEGVFQKTVNDLNLGDEWEIDSAAIGGWHVGNPPDWRALDTMKKHNVPYSNTARQIVSADFNHYDFIFGMDHENMRDLQRKAPKGSSAKLLLFGDYDPEDMYIFKGQQAQIQLVRIYKHPISYKTTVSNSTFQNHDSDSAGFEKCYEQSVRCSKGFLEHLQKEKAN